jgi:hypothetical protein
MDVLIFSDSGDPLRCHSMLPSCYSGVKYAPMSLHKSLFAAGICFPPVQTDANFSRQQHTMLSGWILTFFRTIIVHTFLKNKCSCFCASNTYIVVDEISHTVICLFSKISSFTLNVHICDSRQLNVCVWLVSNFFTAFGKLVNASHTHWSKVGSLLHTVHLSCVEFCLVSLSLSLSIWWCSDSAVAETGCDAILYCL